MNWPAPTSDSDRSLCWQVLRGPPWPLLTPKYIVTIGNFLQMKFLLIFILSVYLVSSVMSVSWGFDTMWHWVGWVRK